MQTVQCSEVRRSRIGEPKATGRPWRQAGREQRRGATRCKPALTWVLIMLFWLAPVTARAGILDWFFPPETPPQLGVAISTTANLADPITLEIIRSKFARISPGTRLLLMERTDERSGKRLALSVDGVWIYVDPSEFRLVEAEQANSDSSNIIMRRSAAVPLTNGGLHVVLPEGTVLPLHEENASSGPFVVKIDSSVFSELRPDKFYKVEVNRNKAVTVDPGVKSAAQVDFFTRGFSGKIFGQFKACDEEKLVKAEYGGSINAELNAKAVYVDLALSANLSRQVTETTKMKAGEIVTIRYYTRTKSGGEFIWKEIESCGDEAPGQFEYRIRVPGPKEIIIKEQVLQSRGIKVDPSSKRPLISCDQDYNALFNYMAEKMDESDIRFFVGLIARWKDHGDMETCTNPS